MLDDSTRQRALTLQRLFEGASARWPNFQGVLIQWEGERPDLPSHLRPPDADKFDLFEKARNCNRILTAKEVSTGFSDRERSRLKTEWYEQREFGMSLSLNDLYLMKLGQPLAGHIGTSRQCEISCWLPCAQSNEAVARWDVLASRAFELFPPYESDFGPCAVGWQMYIHKRVRDNCEPLPGASGSYYWHEPDLFLASAEALLMLANPAIEVPHSEERPQPNTTTIPSTSGMLSDRKLSEKHGVPYHPLRMRLQRLRAKSDDGWVEVQNRKVNEPRYLYCEEAVRPILDAFNERSSEN